MIPVVSVENMRISDQNTILSGVESKLLMYRTAFGIYKAHNWDGKTIIAVGSGNNGGDGFALACILKDQGRDVKIISVGMHRTEDATYFEEMAIKKKVEILQFDISQNPFLNADTVVDCLLGTGFKGRVRAPYDVAVQFINESKAFVLSADINSGMNGDTGEIECCVVPDLVVTIGFLKRGLLCGAAKEIVHKIVCLDIGIALNEEEWYLGENEEDAQDSKLIACPGGLEISHIDVSKIGDYR